MDKGDVVRIAATNATNAILKLYPPESTRLVFRTLEDIVAKGKWRTKVGALDALKAFVPAARDAVAAELGEVLPKVEAAMHDTKQEVGLTSLAMLQSVNSSSVGFKRCHQVCDVIVHNSRQSRPCSTYSGARQVHVQSGFRTRLYKIPLFNNLRSRSDSASPRCPGSAAYPRAQ
jgi:hypothetical protein